MTLVRSWGWWPVRGIDITARARNEPPALMSSDPNFESRMMYRLSKASLTVHWPMYGDRVYQAPQAFEFATAPVAYGHVRFLFKCESCWRHGRVEWRRQVLLISPSDRRLRCPTCLFNASTRSRNRFPMPRDYDALAQRLVQFIEYTYPDGIEDDLLGEFLGNRNLSPILPRGAGPK